ncbi:hypothetical protein B0H17DRAFT_1278223 [Mycena rosella]|uniref:Uncharacterized protein n=1 Tax=Mycena rosella TaxID=1033263 RepID=A0AAD7GLK9_MYCRO|nr:hypothetical protein B0H17DRAFT_1278223 [Mycena rosella]
MSTDSATTRSSSSRDDPWGSGDWWNVDPVEKRKGVPPREKQKLDAPERAPPKRAKRVTVDSKSKDDSDDDGGGEYADQGDSDDEDEDDQLPTLDDGSDADSAPSDADADSDSGFDEPKKSRKRECNLAHPTPHSKAALARRAKDASPSSPRKRVKLAVRSYKDAEGKSYRVSFLFACRVLQLENHIC